MWCITSAASAARQRLHRNSSAQKKPLYYDWGDPDGPGEKPERPKLLPVVPYESVLEPAHGSGDYGARKGDGIRQQEVGTAAQAIEGDEEEPLSTATADRPNSWWSVDSFNSAKPMIFMPENKLSAGTARTRRRLFSMRSLRTPARKQVAKVNGLQIPPRKWEQLLCDNEEIYDKTYRAGCGLVRSIWNKIVSATK